MYLTLKILAGKHVGKELRVSKPQFLIGRGEECHLRPTSGEVSRVHCEINLEDHLAFIRDNNSTNGTYVNGRRITERQQLHSGDVIIVGPLMFEIYLPIDFGNPEGAESSEWAIGDSEVVNLVTGDEDIDNTSSSRTRLLGAQEWAEMMQNQQDLAGVNPPGREAIRKPEVPTPGSSVNTPVQKVAVDSNKPSPLTEELLTAIDAFRHAHPDISFNDVLSSLRHAMLLIEQRMSQK